MKAWRGGAPPPRPQLNPKVVRWLPSFPCTLRLEGILTWPSFDLAEAVNQAIGAIATIISVLVAGRLAFRFALRQLRHERGLDRRLRWYEQVNRVLSNYASEIRLFVSVEREVRAGEAGKEGLRAHILKSLTARGRQLQGLIRKAQLYGTQEEIAAADGLFRLQISVYMESW
ncbi:MAG TPA: hypothetical protein PKC18_20260, partial [Lacipirellulaceae bacterium]|nr:hypothetical protein [Lacipirellulaceae bacterium]